MKTALITGAGSGIGAAAVKKFSLGGYRVVLVGRTESKLKAVSQGLRETKTEVCDLQQPDQIDSLVHRIENIGGIDLLINNAGIIVRGDFLELGLDTWKHQFDTNLFGPVLLTQRIMASMRDRKVGGSILNVSSTLGVRPVARTGAYSASKAAMVNWTQSLALEAAPFKIRVNVLCPGIVETPILSSDQSDLDEEERQQMNDQHPLGRLGTPEEIAEALWYMAHAEWMTGSVLMLDGGISLT